MRIETKYNLGDFVKTLCGDLQFGVITDIRAHVHYKNEKELKFNNQYRIKGRWYYQSDITPSNLKEYQDYHNGRTTTTIDDIY